jgi:hypothetical protein
MRTAILLALVAAVAGCSSPSKVARATIKIQCGANVVEVEQPKDTIIDSMEFSPDTGVLKMYGYQSTANAAAVEASRAQAAAQAETMKLFLTAMQALANRGADAYGVPREPEKANQ